MPFYEDTIFINCVTIKLYVIVIEYIFIPSTTDIKLCQRDVVKWKTKRNINLISINDTIFINKNVYLRRYMCIIMFVKGIKEKVNTNQTVNHGVW